jgi:RimJ/RimL family protein N-acetyltransferase
MKDNIASIKVLEKLGMVFLITFDFDGHEGVVYELICYRGGV